MRRFEKFCSVGQFKACALRPALGSDHITARSAGLQASQFSVIVTSDIQAQVQNSSIELSR